MNLKCLSTKQLFRLERFLLARSEALEQAFNMEYRGKNRPDVKRDLRRRKHYIDNRREEARVRIDARQTVARITRRMKGKQP